MRVVWPYPKWAKFLKRISMKLDESIIAVVCTMFGFFLGFFGALWALMETII